MIVSQNFKDPALQIKFDHPHKPNPHSALTPPTNAVIVLATHLGLTNKTHPLHQQSPPLRLRYRPILGGSVPDHNETAREHQRKVNRRCAVALRRFGSSGIYISHINRVIHSNPNPNPKP